MMRAMLEIAAIEKNSSVSNMIPQRRQVGFDRANTIVHDLRATLYTGYNRCSKSQLCITLEFQLRPGR
jgi:hypothetical protein